MSESKKKLLELEKKEDYLFHGSSLSNLKILEPRQSYTIPRGKNYMVKDGKPAVSVTPYVKIAIFRAIIKKGRSGFSYSNKKIEFRADKHALKFAEGQKGYVYILSRKDFTPRDGQSDSMEWRSDKSVKPLEMIKVSHKDLPEDIKIG